MAYIPEKDNPSVTHVEFNHGNPNNRGIKVGGDYGWASVCCDLKPKFDGSSSTYKTFSGTTHYYSYPSGTQANAITRIPYDYLPGSDIYLHLCWSHNGNNIAGKLNLNTNIGYSKGYGQGAFSVIKTTTIQTPVLNIAAAPKYGLRVEELLITCPSILGHADMEVGGLIFVEFTVTTVPSITGGTTNNPFIFSMDLHYQSTGIGTKNRTPNFYE